MVEEEGVYEETTSYLVPRFNTLHSLILQQLAFGDMAEAEQTYLNMLRLYREVEASDVSFLDKQQAYDRLRLAHEKVYMPADGARWGNLFYPIALVMIVLLIIFFTKPQIIGITGLFAGEINQPPVWTAGITAMSIGDKAQLHMADYFTDPDGDELTYLATKPNNVHVAVSQGLVTLVPEPGVKGVRYITFIASDGEHTTKQVIKLTLV